jgi:hypothetical protein
VRDAARAIAAGRIVFGVAGLVAPRLAAASWVGPAGLFKSTTPLTRGFGARDVLLGMMALHTLDRPEVARRWQLSLAACDAVDGLSSLAARGSLPRRGVAAGLGALGIAAAEVAIARSLADASPPATSA